MLALGKRAVPALSRHLADPLYRGGYILMLNSVVGALLGFAFWVLAARFAPAEAVGAAAAWVSAFTLAALVGKFGTDAALIRYLPPATARARGRMYASALLGVSALTAAIALVLLLANPAPAFEPLRDPWLVLAFVAAAVATAVGWVLDAVVIAQGRPELSLARNTVFNAAKLAGVALGLAAAAAAVGIFGAWLVGVALGTLLVLPLALGYLPRDPGTMPEVQPREFWRFSARNFGQNVAEFAPGLALPLLTVRFVGEVATAHFYAAWTLAFVGILASKAIAQSAFADLARGQRPARDALRKGTLQHLLVLAPFIAGGLLLGPRILALYGPGYAESGTVILALLLLSLPGFAATSLYLAWARVKNPNRDLVLLPALFLVGVLLPAPLLLSWGGIHALALGWAGASTLEGAYAFYRLIRLMEVNP